MDSSEKVEADLNGWHCHANSWDFHRSFLERYKRVLEKGEYTFMLRQISGRPNAPATAELIVPGIYRVQMRDGSKIVVSWRWNILKRVLRPDWQPASQRPEKRAEAAPETVAATQSG